MAVSRNLMSTPIGCQAATEGRFNGPGLEGMVGQPGRAGFIQHRHGPAMEDALAGRTRLFIQYIPHQVMGNQVGGDQIRSFQQQASLN
jgi:hypothetical protein